MKAIHKYVAFMCLLALTSAYLVDWGPLQSLSPAQWLGFAALIGLALISESLALTITVGKSSGNTTITFLPVLSSVVLFGPEAGILCVAIAGGIGEAILRKKEPIRLAFNVGQWVVVTTIAGLVYSAMGGEAIALASDGTSSLADQVTPLLSYAGVFLVLNHAAVSLAISLTMELGFVKVWKRLVGQSASNVLYDLLITPIALAVAFFYLALGLLGLVVALLPLLFVRHSYLTNLQLQQANRDLLKALVKAIETRDPYTSGHSQRVSQLAGLIARQLGLSARKIDEIETAALLHDIGKIEAVYTEVLKKPGGLTNEERAMIESHVIKGVDLLRSIASFGEEVILAVRHHHERIDGKGYPDGLRGDEISIGGRIIKVCDAIDAMLSDRPYRKALSLSAVREQLTMYAGIQFDAEIVDRVVTSRVLEDHQADLAESRSSSTAESSSHGIEDASIPINRNSPSR